MTWKEFFKLTDTKIIFGSVFGVILLLLFIYSAVEGVPPSENFLDKISHVVNFIPYILLYLGAKIMIGLPFPIQFISALIVYFVIPFLWAYFLVCLISFIYTRIKYNNIKKRKK